VVIEKTSTSISIYFGSNYDFFFFQICLRLLKQEALE
jgi:hypothetical protein